MEQQDFRAWTDGSGKPVWFGACGTPLANCLDFFANIGRADAPEVAAPRTAPRQPELWSMLLPEERTLIERAFERVTR